MPRVTGSLVTGQVRAYPPGDIRPLGRPTPPGRAFAEYGRIAEIRDQ